MPKAKNLDKNGPTGQDPVDVSLRADYWSELKFWASISATKAESLHNEIIGNYLTARRRTDRVNFAHYGRTR